MRGYLERCNKPPVKNFVAWLSPQMGVYGVPLVQRLPPVNDYFLGSILDTWCRSASTSISTSRWTQSQIAAFTKIGHRVSFLLQATGEVISKNIEDSGGIVDTHSC